MDAARSPLQYRPRLAWAIALVYLLCVLVIFALAGGPGALMSTLPFPASAGEWAYAAGYLVIVLVGYGWIWPKGVFTDGRAWNPGAATLFGVGWGLSQGLWFYTLWLWCQSGLGSPWLAVGACYLVIALWQALWQSQVWDIYVSPPHNLRAWNARKVAFCHSPNLVYGLLGLALFDSGVVFILMQVLALTLSACVMRFPGWSDRYTAIAGLQR